MIHRIVVGISGASGAALGMRVLELLATVPCVETHLVVTRAGRQTLAHELGDAALKRAEVLATAVHPVNAIGDTVASGSFPTSGMIVVPCSVRTLSAIAWGLSDNLLTRAADVHLKERRRLVLMVRESPLHLGHLRSLIQVTEMGAIVALPVPAFYRLPERVEDIVDAVARRAIGHLGLDLGLNAEPWEGLVDARRAAGETERSSPARQRTPAGSPP